MNIASSGDSFHFGSSQRERNPKSNPTGIHLDFESHSPIKCAGFWSRKPPAQGEVSGKPNFETLISMALWPLLCFLGAGVSEWNTNAEAAQISLLISFWERWAPAPTCVFFMLIWTQGPPGAECTPAYLFSLCPTLFCPHACWVSAVCTLIPWIGLTNFHKMLWQSRTAFFASPIFWAESFSLKIHSLMSWPSIWLHLEIRP